MKLWGEKVIDIHRSPLWMFCSIFLVVLLSESGKLYQILSIVPLITWLSAYVYLISNPVEDEDILLLDNFQQNEYRRAKGYPYKEYSYNKKFAAFASVALLFLSGLVVGFIYVTFIIK